MAVKNEIPLTYQLADHATHIFWTLMGVAIGATIAVFSGAMDMKSELANLLGGILGAGLGAFGGVVGSFVLYSRQRRDLLTPSALTLLDRLRPISMLIEKLGDLPDDQGLLDMLEWSIDGYLKSEVDKEAQIFGAQIRTGCALARTLMRGVYSIMGTEEFDRQRSANNPRIKRPLRVMESGIAELIGELEVIVGRA